MYDKERLTFEDQIARLRERRMVIPDTEAWTAFRSIGYVRLSGYPYPFREPVFVTDEHGVRRIESRLNLYGKGTTFQDVLGGRGHNTI